MCEAAKAFNPNAPHHRPRIREHHPRRARLQKPPANQHRVRRDARVVQIVPVRASSSKSLPATTASTATTHPNAPCFSSTHPTSERRARSESLRPAPRVSSSSVVRCGDLSLLNPFLRHGRLDPQPPHSDLRAIATPPINMTTSPARPTTPFRRRLNENIMRIDISVLDGLVFQVMSTEILPPHARPRMPAIKSDAVSIAIESSAARLKRSVVPTVPDDGGAPLPRSMTR